MNYVQTGEGEINLENATFTPHGFYMDITPEIKKILELLRPVCLESPGDSPLLLDKQTDYETSRFDIVAAIGCTQSDKMKVVEEHRTLKMENVFLTSLANILETLEIHHNTGTFKKHLTEMHLGKDRNDKYFLMAYFSEETWTVPAKDMASSRAISLSGIPMEPVPPALIFPNNDDNGMTDIQFKYENGGFVYGSFDSAVSIEEFGQSDTPVKLKRAGFCMSPTLLGILSALGIQDPRESR